MDRSVSLEAVSCAASALCAAVANTGAIFASRDPARGAGSWHGVNGVLSNPGTRLGGVACPTVSLCVAVNGTNQIATSTDPASTNPTWTTQTVGGERQLDGVACPLPSACLVLDYNGAVLASTDPAGGTATWSETTAPFQYGSLFSLSCASPSLCVLTGEADTAVVFTSMNPFAATPTWVATSIDKDNYLNAISCAPSGMCVAGDSDGNLIASPDAASGAATWQLARAVDPAGFISVACPSASLCLAGDDSGDMATSTAPDTATPVWSISQQLGSGATRNVRLTSVACSSVSLCVAIDDAGGALVSTHPDRGPSAWRRRSINAGLDLSAVSCAPTGFCAGVGQNDYVATSTAPAAKAARWRLTNLNLHSLDNNGGWVTDSLSSISCTSSAFCVANRMTYIGAYNLEVSLNPGATRPAWRGRSAGDTRADEFTTVSCPSPSLCVANDGEFGEMASSTDHGTHWKLTYVETPGAENGSLTPNPNTVNCPATSFCVAGDDAGQLLTSNHPTGGSRYWVRTRLRRGYQLETISCASSSFCAGIDQKGRVLVSDQPGVPGPRWTLAPVGKGITGVSCPSTRMCLLINRSGQLIVGRVG